MGKVLQPLDMECSSEEDEEEEAAGRSSSSRRKRSGGHPPAPSKKSSQRRQRQARYDKKKLAELQYRVLLSRFGDDAPDVEGKSELLRARLLAAARGALSRQLEAATAGQRIATIHHHVFRQLYAFVSDEAAAAGRGWSQGEVDLLRGLSPPQCHDDISMALSSQDECMNVLLLVSKCAVGDHVAMAPQGQHATLLAAARRAGGPGTVVLDVPLRPCLCRPSSTGGACQDLDKKSGMCAVVDKSERRVAEVFMSVLLELLADHVLTDEEGRITVAVNHTGWPTALDFVHEQRRSSKLLRHALRPTVIQLGHYRYLLGDSRCMHGRAHLLLGLFFAGGVASGTVGEDVLAAVKGALVDTYKEVWKVKRSGDAVATEAPMLLLATAEALFDGLAGTAFLPSPPTAFVDLSHSYLTSTDDLYDIDGPAFTDEIAQLRLWYHELTTARREVPTVDSNSARPTVCPRPKIEETRAKNRASGLALNGDGSAAGKGVKRKFEVKCSRCPNTEVVEGTEYWCTSHTRANGDVVQLLQIGGVRMSCLARCYAGKKEAKYSPTTCVTCTLPRK